MTELKNEAWMGDCLELMQNIPDGSIDMILCDLPYGTTACKWDAIIPFDLLWDQYERIVKPNGAIVLTASQPFTSALVMSNPKMFKYDFVWDKVNRYTGFLNSNRMPLRKHESILVFYKKLGTYNKQMSIGNPYKAKRSGNGYEGVGAYKIQDGESNGERNPHSILSIIADVKTEVGLHPTQKPIALFEYLIRTYTNEGETVLDNTAGVFTTAIACLNTNRNYIVIEKEPEYFYKGTKRIEDWHEIKNATQTPNLFSL